MRLIPANEFCARYWPVSARTQRRYELRSVDPFPVKRINRRRYVDPDEAAAWLARQTKATSPEPSEADAAATPAACTGEVGETPPAEPRVSH